MIELAEFLQRLSIISIGLYFLRRLRKNICMAMAATSAASKQSSSSTPPPTWLSSFFVEKGAARQQFGSSKRQKITDYNIKDQEIVHENQSINHTKHQLVAPETNKPIREACKKDPSPKENDGLVAVEVPDVVKISSTIKNPFEMKQSTMLKTRPAQLIVPAYNCPASDFCQVEKKLERKEFQAEGKGFAMASKKGRREIMEDGHGVMLDISGNPKHVGYWSLT